MADYDSYTFNKKYRISNKNDDDMFHVRYQISQEQKSQHSDQDDRSKDTKNIHPHKIYKERTAERQQLPQKKSHRQYIPKKTCLPNEPQSHLEPSLPKDTNQDQEQNQQSQQIQKLVKVPPKIEVDVKLIQSKQKYQMMQQLFEDNQSQELSQIQLTNKRNKSDEINQVFKEMELNKNPSSIPQPRKLYDQYIQQQEIVRSRISQEKVYFKGRIEFSESVKWYCKIISEELEGTLIVEGKNMNRCLHQDEVYFKVAQETKDKVLCIVVAIISRAIKRVVGKIEFHKSKQIYLLKSTNNRIATMNLHLDEINKQYLEHIHSKYFIAECIEWQVTQEFPHCKIIDQYGNFGQIQIETNSLLKTFGIEDKQYTPEDIERFLEPFKKNINAEGQFVISQQQLKKRKDFRKWKTFFIKDCQYNVAFSIFPVTIRKKQDPNFLRKNVYEVNIHLIDVAYFVRQNSAIDEQAQKRLASYNLVHKIISLLPFPLDEKICNLRLNKDLLTLSIGFQIDEDGLLLEISKITKSIISPAFSFTQDNLLKIISNEPVPFQEWKAWNSGCNMESQFRTITSDIKLLNNLIMKSRKKRIQNGALMFQTPNKFFKLDADLNPTNFELKVKNDVNYMIEECVIAASTKVGEFLLKNLKSKAILYRHKFPGVKKLQQVKQLLQKIGYALPQQKSTEFQKNINSLLSKENIKQCVKDVLKFQTIRLLENSDYFLTKATDPSSWVHYAINIPIYSHCSTPKSCYADIIVQRQIISILQNEIWKIDDPIIEDKLQLCNKAKVMSKHIQNACQKMFLCIYLRDNAVFTSAVLTSVEEWGIKVCVPKFNFKTVIKFKNIKSITVTKYDTDTNLRKYVKLDFKSANDIKSKIVLKELQQIDVQIKSANSYPLDYVVTLALPHPNQPQNKILVE